MAQWQIHYTLLHTLNNWATGGALNSAIAVGLAVATPYLYLLLLTLLHLYSISTETPRHYRYWLATFGAGAGATVGVALSKGLSLLFPTSRPFTVTPVHLLIHHSPDSSFPSDHTTFLVAIGTALLYWGLCRLGLLLVAVGVVAGLARVAVGVHWPLDIAGGVVVGVVGGVLGGWLVKRLAGRKGPLPKLYRAEVELFHRLRTLLKKGPNG